MQPTCFVSGEPEDPRAQRWLREASLDAYHFSREVHGNHPRSNASDMMAIRGAAATLWRATGGEPCWSKLEPEAVIADLTRDGHPTAYIEDVLFTLYTFYCYLAKHEVIDRARALEAQDRFVPHVRDLVRRVVEDHDQPDDLADHPALRAPRPPEAAARPSAVN